MKKIDREDGFEDNITMEENANVHIHPSVSPFDQACSSLAHLYHDCQVDRDRVSKDLWTKLGTYKKGYHREAARE